MELFKPIADYFEADRGRDAVAVSRCFTEDAVVKDEGRTCSGREAIRRWKAEASTRFNYTVEPFRMDVDGSLIVVTSHVMGDFPGSPVDLRYLFKLAGGQISALEITL
ncbi:nuclear transport factor 2 family protein [Falsiroseomonas sp. HC035]|uniref:nuclear transport factor 2 family protein n=1 Tax=Falsiroseomonas sp. HC035 TaxID=3390999 RepID=UPI003D319C9A